MFFRLLGFSHYGFTNDQGRYVEGYKFHICRKSFNPNFQGEEVAAVSVSEQLVQRCGDPDVGKLYSVSYDPKGRIAAYALAQQAQTKIAGT